MCVNRERDREREKSINIGINFLIKSFKNFNYVACVSGTSQCQSQIPLQAMKSQDSSMETIHTLPMHIQSIQGCIRARDSLAYTLRQGIGRALDTALQQCPPLYHQGYFPPTLVRIKFSCESLSIIYNFSAVFTCFFCMYKSSFFPANCCIVQPTFVLFSFILHLSAL